MLQCLTQVLILFVPFFRQSKQCVQQLQQLQPKSKLQVSP